MALAGRCVCYESPIFKDTDILHTGSERKHDIICMSKSILHKVITHLPLGIFNVLIIYIILRCDQFSFDGEALFTNCLT